MKKTLTRIGALTLALVLMLAVCAVAVADTDATLTGGEVGGFASPDNPQTQSKIIHIQKELTAYNKDGSNVYAPEITYTYTVTAGTAGQDVTDVSTDHASGIGALKTPTLAGVIPLLSVTGSVDGTANTAATAAANGNSVVNTIQWTNASTLTTAATGDDNIQDLKLDFSNVVFGGPGVYRYQIAETEHTDAEYTACGVTETNGTHTRYLDVYVRPANNFVNGTNASDWDIYGYVCLYDDDATTDSSSAKTNGFVADANHTADSYYTYNLTVSKTVTNDAYGAATVNFPFTVLFTNSNITTNVDIASSTTGSTGGWTNPAAGAFDSTTHAIAGNVTLKNGASVTYIGVPCGTAAEVYETNVASGVTYTVTTTTDGATPATVDSAVVWHTAPQSAVTQVIENGSKAHNYESTKATISTTANTADTTSHTVVVNNALVNISPTGIAFRVAPFVMILATGIVLLALIRRRREEIVEA